MSVKKYYITGNNKPGYPYDRNARKHFSWGFDIWINGQRIRERGILTKQEAETSIAQLKQQARNDRHGIPTPKDPPLLIDLFQRKLDRMPEGKDRVRAKRVMTAFLKLVPPEIKVTELRSVHIQEYIQSRAGLSPGTIRRELVPIVAALNSAGDFFEDLEAYRPPKITRPKISKTRKSRVITPDELKSLLSYLLDPQNDRGRGLMRRVGLFLQMCLLTASRPGEIAHLKKTDVDFTNMLLRVEGTKTRFESTAGLRYLNITPTMERILRERIEAAEAEFLFTRSGRITGKMDEALKFACEANGLDYGRPDPLGITFGRSRHTGLTSMSRAGVDIQTVGAVAGHSNSTMSLHYVQSDPEAMKRASLELEKQFGDG